MLILAQWNIFGYVISGDGIFLDSKKVEAIINWEQPKNVSKIRSFLGLTGYYRWFVEHFSLIATPLTRLTRKGVKYEWDEMCEQSFQELNNRLITALVLVLMTARIGFVMFSDASIQWLGCVLI